MKIKLMIFLLVLCLAFSFGLAQAQMGGYNISQQGNLSTAGNACTLANVNKTITVSQQTGGDVKWILPGPRRLDP